MSEGKLKKFRKIHELNVPINLPMLRGGVDLSLDRNCRK